MTRPPESAFAWKTLTAALIRAIAADTGDAFCDYMLPQLNDAIRAASATGTQGQATLPPDYLDLQDSLESLRLVKEWYLPSRRGGADATAAAAALRGHVDRNWTWHGPLPDDEEVPKAARRDLERRLDRFLELVTDPVFLARVAARLASYELNPRRSPARAVRDAVSKEMRRELDSGKANPRAIGDELRRLFQLPETDTGRVQLKGCLLRIDAEQRECLTVLYAPSTSGGYKALDGKGKEGKGWSGRKIAAVRSAAIDALAECMPELNGFR